MRLTPDQPASTPGAAFEAALRALLRNATLEATPRQILSRPDPFTGWPMDTPVYVPFLPNADFADTLAACRQLRAEGIQPIPHLPARLVPSRSQLDGWLADLAGNGVTRLLLIAGDADRPRGPFRDTLAVLDSGLLAHHGFFDLGVAGHPDGHPKTDTATLADALARKRDYAAITGTRLWVVTQFGFDAARMLSWLDAWSPRLGGVPVYLGLPGPTGLRTLMRYAAQCGVGRSTRQVLRRPGTARLLKAWTPDGVVEVLAQHKQRHPHSPLAGIHFFPFGGLNRTLDWIDRQRQALDPAPANASNREAEP